MEQERLLPRLVNNRFFAIVYRGITAVLTLLAVLHTFGVFAGTLKGELLLYYTVETNLLALVCSAILLYKTAAKWKREGQIGSSSFYERFSAISATAIFLTMIGYWVFLAPLMGIGNFACFNLQLHLFTPLLIIGDFFLFAQKGKLKPKDPFYFCLAPIYYFIQATAIGFLTDITYQFDEGMSVSRFPYFFVDYDKVGWMVAVYVLIIAIFFTSSAYGLYRLDQYLARKQKS
jgi:hypothetical protein